MLIKTKRQCQPQRATVAYSGFHMICTGGDAILRVGERIRELREARKISQRELARRLNISHTAVWAYENGQAGVDADFLREVGVAIGVPPAAFYEEVLGDPILMLSTDDLMALLTERVAGMRSAQKPQDTSDPSTQNLNAGASGMGENQATGEDATVPCAPAREPVAA